jgi:predicted RNA-binding protein
MAYFIDLFSPETYEAFRSSSRDVSGFRLRQKAVTERIKPGDMLVCYMTRLSRWFGLLEVVEGPYIDSKPIFAPEDEPFVVRFRVRPLILFDPEKSIPIHDKEIWKGLSFTRKLEPGSLAWTGMVRSSLVHLDDGDGRFLADKMKAQVRDDKTYPLDDDDRRKLRTHTINRSDKVIAVSVPDDLALSEEAEVPRKSGPENPFASRRSLPASGCRWDCPSGYPEPTESRS